MRWRKSFALGVVAIAALAFALWAYLQHRSEGSLTTAIAAFQNGAPADAIPVFRRFANKGDAEALFYLGRAYYEGKGVAADARVAATYFVRASDLGNVNAPVWAGQIFEALGEVPRSAELHRIALQRAAHLTSMLALGRFHRTGVILGANSIAAARHFAAAQGIQAGIGVQDDRLTSFSCFELAQALFVEETGRGSPVTNLFSNLAADLNDCSANGKKPLVDRLVSAALARVKAAGNGAIDENVGLGDLTGKNRDPLIRTVRAPFVGMMAFASDADADELEVSLAYHAFLNDYLGLPFASSIFPLNTTMGPTATAFFSDIRLINETPIAGLPTFFVLARDWHRGRYDHFHSWYNDGRTVMMRPSKGLLREGIDIDLQPLIARASPIGERRGQVMRLYFSARVPEDMRLTFETKERQAIAANSAELVNAQRDELDEGGRRHVIVLTLPAVFPQFAVPVDNAVDIYNMVSLKATSRSCSAGCEIALDKVELGVFDRQTAIKQADKLRGLNIFPYGYTSHGGEEWQLHGDPGLLNAYWQQLKAGSAQKDVVHEIPSFTMASIADTKGYIEDLLSELGVRAVRPERVPGPDPSSSMHDWNEPPKMVSLYQGKVTFGSTYYGGAPLGSYSNAPAGSPVLEKRRDYLKSRLGRWAALAGTGCVTPDCNLSHNSSVAALVAASLRRADENTGPFSHAWYTHFGARTKSFRPTAVQPFTEDGRRAFERAAEAHYGLTAAGERTIGPRVLAAASTTVLRQRKLDYIISAGLLSIEREGDIWVISSGIDPFLSTIFPAPSHESRDLAGLSFEVDDVFAAKVKVGDMALDLARVRRDPAAGNAGTVTVIDTETRHTFSFAALSSSTELILRLAKSPKYYEACGTPTGNARVFNATYFSFRNPFSAQTAGEIEIMLDVQKHPQSAFGLPGGTKRHVFTTAPGDVASDGIGTTVHRIDLPNKGGLQPAEIHIDLAQPERYLPGMAGSPGDLNMNGTISKICVRVTPALRRTAPATIDFGPLRVYGATLSDENKAETGWLVGGQVAWSKDKASRPMALRFTSPDVKEEVTVTVDDGFYIGKLPAPGIYSIAVVDAACRLAPATHILIERDSLDTDLTVAGCQVTEGFSNR